MPGVFKRLAEKKRERQEMEFLPAALEIIETPPSLTGRLLLWLIMLFFTIAVIWSILGRVDEVAVAPGKVIPSGYTKVIQAEDKGIVRKISVTNGTPVKAGGVLIVLDTVNSEADMTRMVKERDFYVLDLARLYAERDHKPFIPPKGVGEKDVVQHQVSLFESRRLELASRMNVLQQQVMAARQSLNSANERYGKYKEIFPIASEQSKRTEELARDGTVSLFEHQNYLQKEIELRQEMRAQQADVERGRHAVYERETDLQRLKSEWYSNISAKIVEDKKQLQSIEEELIKAKEKHRLSRIVSPIDGVVQQLEVHTVGGILTPAQPLMLIVPADAGIEFEVWLDNKDIGFVYAGQPAEVKVETFGFQKYGTLESVVKSVATEAREDEKRGLIYQAFMSASRDYYMIEGKKVPLLPGMAVTGEIKIRKKRIIEFFMDTFRRYVSESLRE